MRKESSTITVFFEDPFWVLLYTRSGRPPHKVAKLVLGRELSDTEIYEELLAGWGSLPFLQTGPLAAPPPLAQNPKRRQRQAARHISAGSTHSQQALAAARAENKTHRKQNAKHARQAHQKEQFARRQAAKKQKHRGR